MKLDHRLKLGWFGLLGALAFQGRFIALFFRDRGFTNSEIGFILGSNPVISAIGTYFIKNVRDERDVLIVPLIYLFTRSL